MTKNDNSSYLKNSHWEHIGAPEFHQRRQGEEAGQGPCEDERGDEPRTLGVARMLVGVHHVEVAVQRDEAEGQQRNHLLLKVMNKNVFPGKQKPHLDAWARVTII